MKKLTWLIAVFFFTSCGEGKINDSKIWSETKVSSGLLGGTMLDAGKEAAIVIIVPGSGPTDKDGNAMGMVSNSYKQLAEGLAKTGISSIRVDKRGMFSSAEAGSGNDVSVEIYAEDYRAWTETAIDLTDQPCAFLLGHSEGGLMVSAAAVDNERVCGVITVAAPGYRLSDVMRKQFKANPANKPILEEAFTAIGLLEAEKRVDVSEMHPAVKRIFSPPVQDFLISVFQVDPAELLSKVAVPKLVVQGSHDVQVSVDDARRLAEKGTANLVVLEGISHILKPAPADFAANIQTYNSPNEPVDESVINSIAGFIHKTRDGE